MLILAQKWPAEMVSKDKKEFDKYLRFFTIKVDVYVFRGVDKHQLRHFYISSFRLVRLSYSRDVEIN